MCGWSSPVLLSLTMSTASSLGKLIKLKCLTGNHSKVKEMLCKLLLAPVFLRVGRSLSVDVCGFVSAVDEQSWNVENWIVTVDFPSYISERKETFHQWHNMRSVDYKHPKQSERMELLPVRPCQQDAVRYISSDEWLLIWITSQSQNIDVTGPAHMWILFLKRSSHNFYSLMLLYSSKPCYVLLYLTNTYVSMQVGRDHQMV